MMAKHASNPSEWWLNPKPKHRKVDLSSKSVKRKRKSATKSWAARKSLAEQLGLGKKEWWA
jgi:hypothetical protein